MAERDYVKELEGLKTSLMGYDRESVMAYIRDLIVEKDAERGCLEGNVRPPDATGGRKCRIAGRD